MSNFTIQDRGTFRLVTSTSGKRFYVFKEKYGLFAKLFIAQDKRCIADSFQIGLLESIIFSVNNNALTLKFWLANRKKLAPNLAFFLEQECRFYINHHTKNMLNEMKKATNESDYKDSFQDYYYSPINTLGFIDPPQYPSNSDDSVWPSSSSNSDDNSSSSSSFDFGGGDTAGGGAGGDY